MESFSEFTTGRTFRPTADQQRFAGEVTQLARTSSIKNRKLEDAKTAAHKAGLATALAAARKEKRAMAKNMDTSKIHTENESTDMTNKAAARKASLDAARAKSSFAKPDGTIDWALAWKAGEKAKPIAGMKIATARSLGLKNKDIKKTR